MIRDLYNLKPLLFSFVISSQGLCSKDEETEGYWDEIDNLINIYLDKIYEELNNKEIFINIYQIEKKKRRSK